MHSNEILFPLIHPALSVVPTTSHIGRRNARRPLQSSPLTGPALSSEGAVIQEDHVLGRPRPSRISSLPEFSKSTDYWVESIPPLPVSESHQRKSLPPAHLTISNSTPLLPKTSSSCPSKPPRPSSGGNIHSLSQNISHAPHRTSSSLHDTGETWLITSTYEETPRFSRPNKGSNVVMPVSVKEHRRKSLASVKSQPSLRDRSANRTRDVRREDGVLKRTIQPRRSLSSLPSKVRQRANAIMSLDTDVADSCGNAIPRQPYSRSVTSRPSSSTKNISDNDSFISSPPPLPPSDSAHSSESFISNFVIVDDAETIQPDSTDLVLPGSADLLPLQPPDHQRSASNTTSKSSTVSIDSRNSFGAFKWRTKDVLRKSRSFVHSRASSSVDPILGSTVSSPFVAPRKHVKGFSFLSFSSSDDSHSFHVPPVPGSLPDGIGMTTISDTSSDSDLATDDTHIDYQKEAGQLLYDAFPRPPSIDYNAISSMLPAPLGEHNRSNLHALPKTRPPELDMNERLGSPLPRTPTPSSPTGSSSRTLVSPPTPTFKAFKRGTPDQILPQNIGFGGRPFASTLDLSSTSPLRDSPTASFLSIGDDNVIPPRVSSRPKLPGAASAKAMNLLGVLDGPSNQAQAAIPRTVGTMKKFWKNLTGGEKDLVKSRA
ncbi:hypothetical protein F5879DRAFT_984442 [Lentinula edodes]|uniref:uncharacterized protein n=1 Tax=Lentinula edodes TaxID=5353 RepID=UPI001E8EAAF2|nr:uncharacterized protein C8R40DRAFT_269988 [Lentinula edodes]KAH7880650.1 hypothetical protein C8R40DRAFT_269988 [Lentinula edodes]KAJ3909795.1 hypothetical protein F5879DRAFT_984442 [Lentinula edodes]